MSESETIRVMVVDDQEMVRRGIAALIGLREDTRVVAEAGDARTALALFREHRPDVSIVDIRMPGMDGIELVKTLRGEFPDARFVMLTTYEDETEARRAIQVGAQGYLLKGMRLDELIDAIRTVHRGGYQIPSALAARAMRVNGGLDLTPRELDVLRLVARGISNKEIGAELSISESTVKGHVNNLMAKLGVTARTQAAMVAVQRKIVSLD